MRYEFLCESCPGTEENGKVIAFLHEREIPITKAPPEGKKVKCPCCGRKTAKRILSTGILGHVKGKALYDWKPGTRMRQQVNGQEVAFEFVDHPHTDPKLQRNLAGLAKQHGISQGLSKARFDEKSGRVVVDVASNVPDPLGMIARAKRSGENYTEEKRAINQKYKTRPGIRPHPVSNVGEAMRRAKAKRNKQ